MGIIRMGPPTKLIVDLRDKFNLKDFIETGTYYGETAIWASDYFENVISIECSKEIYGKAVDKYGEVKNVEFLLGDSKSVLMELVPKLTGPAMFWLDAHWSGGETYGEDDKCPLIEEIHAINISRHDHFIFIDDARLFCSPPPRPHRVEQWPSIGAVIDALKHDVHKRYIVIIEDVIVAVPECAREVVANYCQDLNSDAWEKHGKLITESKTGKGLRLIGEGLRLIGQVLIVKIRGRIRLKG